MPKIDTKVSDRPAPSLGPLQGRACFTRLVHECIAPHLSLLGDQMDRRRQYMIGEQLSFVPRGPSEAEMICVEKQPCLGTQSPALGDKQH